MSSKDPTDKEKRKAYDKERKKAYAKQCRAEIKKDPARKATHNESERKRKKKSYVSVKMRQRMSNHPPPLSAELKQPPLAFVKQPPNSAIQPPTLSTLAAPPFLTTPPRSEPFFFKGQGLSKTFGDPPERGSCTPLSEPVCGRFSTRNVWYAN
jgi:hypothetical protein